MVQKYPGGKITSRQLKDGAYEFKQDYTRETLAPAEWVEQNIKSKFVFRDSYGSYCWEKGWKTVWRLEDFPDGGDGSGPKGFELQEHCMQRIANTYGVDGPSDLDELVVVRNQAEALSALVMKLRAA